MHAFNNCGRRENAKEASQPVILWIQLKQIASIVFIGLQIGLDCGCFSFFSAALYKCCESQGSVV